MLKQSLLIYRDQDKHKQLNNLFNDFPDFFLVFHEVCECLQALIFLYELGYKVTLYVVFLELSNKSMGESELPVDSLVGVLAQCGNGALVESLGKVQENILMFKVNIRKVKLHQHTARFHQHVIHFGRSVLEQEL